MNPEAAAVLAAPAASLEVVQETQAQAQTAIDNLQPLTVLPRAAAAGWPRGLFGKGPGSAPRFN